MLPPSKEDVDLMVGRCEGVFIFHTNVDKAVITEIVYFSTLFIKKYLFQNVARL